MQHRPRAVLSGGSGRMHTPSAGGADWSAETSAFASELTDEARASLAAGLGVRAAALADLGCGWASLADLRRLRAGGEGWRDNYPAGAFTFPERNGSGGIIGLSLRAANGRKGFPAAAKRGLIVPISVKDLPDPVLIREGPSDVDACLTLRLAGSADRAIVAARTTWRRWWTAAACWWSVSGSKKSAASGRDATGRSLWPRTWEPNGMSRCNGPSRPRGSKTCGRGSRRRPRRG